MKGIINRYIKSSVFVICIFGTGITNSLANTFFESSLSDSNSKLSPLKFLSDSKTCSSNNNFNANLVSDTNNQEPIANSLFSSVTYKGRFRLDEHYVLQNISEVSVFPSDYIYKVANIISENLSKTRLGVPGIGECVLLFSGLGLVCLQISSNSHKMESSYLG